MSSGALSCSMKALALHNTIILIITPKSFCLTTPKSTLNQHRQGRIRSILPYHGAIDGPSRAKNVEDFSRLLLKRPVCMICTDRASRGMFQLRDMTISLLLFMFHGVVHYKALIFFYHTLHQQYRST